MLEELKRKTLAAKLLQSVLLAAAGLALILLAGHGAQTLPLLLGGGENLYAIPLDELEGRYVSAKITVIYDCYAETSRSSGSDPYMREFVIPVGDYEFMGVNVPKSQFDAAEAVMESTWAVLDGEAGGLDGSSIQVSGTVTAMDSQTKRFYQQTVGYDSFSQADQALFLPLVIETGMVGPYEKSDVYFWLLIGAALIAAGIVMLALALTGWYQRRITAWCKAQPDPEGAKLRLDQFYHNAAQLGKVKADREFLLYESGAASFLLPVSEVAWVYQTTTRHRRNGIPTGTTYALTLRGNTPKRTTHTIPLKSEAEVQELMRFLLPYLSRAWFGYKPELERLYNTDPARFAQTMIERGAAEQASPVPPPPAPANPGPPRPSDAADNVPGSYSGR